MRTVLGATVAITLLLSVLVLPVLAKPPEGLHCPDFNSPNKVESVVDGDLDNVVLPAGTLFCVKGGPQDATGYLTADGTTTVGEYLPGKYNVSYYITYEGVEPSVTPPISPPPTTTPSASPSMTPAPSATPQVTSPPSPEPSESPSPEPTVTPTPSVTPSPTNTPTPVPSMPIPTPPATDTE